MKKVKIDDLNIGELKERYHKVSNGLAAIDHIIDMMQPNPGDAWYVVGFTLGRTLYKFTNEKEVDDMLKQICTHAKLVYKETHQDEAEEQAANINVKH